MNRFSVKLAIACGLYLAMAAFKTYPLILQFNSHIAGMLGDPLLVTWIMAWGVHALTTDPSNLFQANINYPADNSLAFSDHLLGLLPIFAPFYLGTGNPVLAHNGVFFFSFVMCGISMFLLVHYWTRNFWASLVAGCLYAFSPVRFGQYGHLSLLNLYWAPLVLLFFDRFLRSRRWGDLAGFAIFYWWQVLCAVYLGWFTTIAIAVYFLSHVTFVDRSLVSRALLPKFLTFAGLTLLILVPLHLPYYEVSWYWDYVRTLSDNVFWSADLLNYLNIPPLMNDWYISLFSFAKSSKGNWEKYLFPGFVTIILVGIGSIPGNQGKLFDGASQMKRSFWLVLLTSFILSLGPFLILFDKNTHIPLPHLLLHYVVPGFNSMRVPARFGLMVSLAASVLAALGFLRLSQYLGSRSKFRRVPLQVWQAGLAFLCIGLFVLELGFKPFPLAKIETGHQVPPVYHWLAQWKPGPIVEYPMENPDEFRYKYFSTYHWLPIVSGLSGFVPPTHNLVKHQVLTLPSRKAVEFLSGLGIRALVVHTGKLQPQEALKWRETKIKEVGLVKVKEFGPDWVYAFPEMKTKQPPDLRFAFPDELPSDSKMKLKVFVGGTLQRSSLLRGKTKTLVTWRNQETGKSWDEKGEMNVPAPLPDVFLFGLEVRTPSDTGLYSLRMDLPDLGITKSKVVRVLHQRSLQASLNAKELLSIIYPDKFPLPLVMKTSTQVPFSIRVRNNGQAVWFARTKGGVGGIRMGWRWFVGDQEVFSKRGLAYLPYDVFPGETVVIEGWINQPKIPGEYYLEIDMFIVNEPRNVWFNKPKDIWFSEIGHEPMKATVKVMK